MVHMHQQWLKGKILNQSCTEQHTLAVVFKGKKREKLHPRKCKRKKLPEIVHQHSFPSPEVKQS